MCGYIYLTTNLINNKKYIGQHKSEEFDSSYLGSGVTLQKALNKYGKENFKCELLKECYTIEELNEAEIYYIEQYNAVDSDDFYNIARGGLGHTCSAWNKGLTGIKVSENSLKALEYGRHLPASEKQKQQLAERRRGCVVSEETREKLRKAQLGRKASEETKRKQSIAHSGERNANYGGLKESAKRKLSEHFKNTRHIHKGSINKIVKDFELDDYLSDGWELGFIYKNRK